MFCKSNSNDIFSLVIKNLFANWRIYYPRPPYLKMPFFDFVRRNFISKNCVFHCLDALGFNTTRINTNNTYLPISKQIV